LLPGGEAGLNAGTFTEVNAQNALNKAAVQSDGGTEFRVMLDYENVALGDDIVLTLQGYNTMDGTGTETPNTLLTLPYKLLQTDLPDSNGGPAKYHDFFITTGYFAGKWNQPPQGRGSVIAKYTIKNDKGTANATEQLVIVAVIDL
jgi:hypothetical protein